MDVDAPPRRDRRAERHAATRAEVVQAAWELSDAQGLAGWSLRDVAAAVGMRAPSLYVYFDSKSALYDAMFADGCRALLDRLQGLPQDGEPTDLLRRGAREFVQFCVERPARHFLLFLRPIPGFEPSPESYALAQEAMALTTAALRAAGLRGTRAVDLWTAVLSGLATQQVSNDPGGTRWSRLVDDAVAMLLAHSTQRTARR